MPTDTERQQAHTAARDALLRHIPHILADQAAETIVTELDGVPEMVGWLARSSAIKRAASLSAYSTLGIFYGLDRSTIDAAVVAAANRLGTQY
jgi:hypothetical protein